MIAFAQFRDLCNEAMKTDTLGASKLKARVCVRTECLNNPPAPFVSIQVLVRDYTHAAHRKTHSYPWTSKAAVNQTKSATKDNRRSLIAFDPRREILLIDSANKRDSETWLARVPNVYNLFE